MKTSREGFESAASHGTGHLGIILDSSTIIAAERKQQSVAEFLMAVRQELGDLRGYSR